MFRLPQFLTSAAVVAMITACNGAGNFGGSSKKINKAPTPVAPATSPPATPPTPVAASPDLGTSVPGSPSTNGTTVSPSNPVIVTPQAPSGVGGQSLPRPQPPVQPTVPPPAAPPATPPAPPNPPPAQGQEVGALMFRAVPFVNMEHRAHATEPGSFAILKNASGKVVAAGAMTPEVACRGENQDSMAYPVVKLSVPLNYLAGDAQSGASASGNGTLSVCIVSDPNAAGDALQCQRVDRGNDGDRPAFWYDVAVSYRISGTTIDIDNPAGYGAGGSQGGDGGANGNSAPAADGFTGVTEPVSADSGDGLGLKLYGGSENIRGGLSFAHPIQAPVCGSRARGYADYNSPLVLDLDHNGKVDLVNVWGKQKAVYFDADGTGTKVRTGWVAPGDGLLALDVNGDGRITSGAQLFGENSRRLTPVDKWAFRNFDSGFQALAQYDDDKNGIIDERDAIFAKLRVWRDANQDGASTSEELQTLKEAGVASLSLAYAKTGSPGHYDIVAMNEVRLTATYTAMTGKTYGLYDVWFAVRPHDTAKLSAKAAEGTK